VAHAAARARLFARQVRCAARRIVAHRSGVIACSVWNARRLALFYVLRDFAFFAGVAAVLNNRLFYVACGVPIVLAFWERTEYF
jgi:hypothetical protein